MKRGVLTCFGSGKTKNIGDYIQSIAAAQFAGENACWVERERMDEYAGGPTKLIMNGWFMLNPRRFPPAEDIIPLFLSFHVRPLYARAFFTEKTIAYLRRFEPIGCRSRDAVELLNRYGIKAEFTSCLTLTLGETFKHVESSDPPIFVDPFFIRNRNGSARGYFLWFLRRFAYLLCNFKRVRRMAHKMRVFRYRGMRFAIVRYLNAAEFLRAYSTVFSDEVLFGARFVTHDVPKAECGDDAAMFAKARELLSLYAHAPFVVTGRLHCTLPCIGMGTPVWTTIHPSMTTGRYGGNMDFMNVLPFDGDRLARLANDRKLNLSDRPPIKDEHLPFVRELTRRCRRFMEEPS